MTNHTKITRVSETESGYEVTVVRRAYFGGANRWRPARHRKAQVKWVRARVAEEGYVDLSGYRCNIFVPLIEETTFFFIPRTP